MQKQILLLSLLILVPATASAASVSLQATPTSVGAGDVVRVDVLLSSANPTNAFSGTLTYSASTLEPLAVSDGNSIINLWLTHPALSAPGAPITFAGITPGGFSGDTGRLFYVLFRAKATGTAEISLQEVQVLRNDGAGGAEPVTLAPLTLAIGSRSSGGYTEAPDQTPPEPFTAYLGTDPQLFSGHAYLVFMAVDKNSGVDQYAIAETRLPSFLLGLFPLSWRTVAESPVVLSDQNLTSTVYVKAIDRAGNERLSVFPRPHLFTSYEKALLLGAIVIAIVCLWRLSRRRRVGKKL